MNPNNQIEWWNEICDLYKTEVLENFPDYVEGSQSRLRKADAQKYFDTAVKFWYKVCPTIIELNGLSMKAMSEIDPLTEFKFRVGQIQLKNLTTQMNTLSITLSQTVNYEDSKSDS